VLALSCTRLFGGRRQDSCSARSNAKARSQDLDMRLSLEGSKGPESLNVPHNSVGWLSALSPRSSSPRRANSLPGNFHRATFVSRLFSENERIWKKEKGATLDPIASRRLSSPDGGIPYCRAQHRGHSSVGRAVALQAIGQGFESPCLQSCGPADGSSAKR
jgi:hypothetical protein